MRVRARSMRMGTAVCVAAVGAVGLAPGTAGAGSGSDTVGAGPASGAVAHASKAARVFKMIRKDMRVLLVIRGGKVVRARVRARERCGNGASGFLLFDLPRSETIGIRGGRFEYRRAFDDARGNGVLVLSGLVHRRTIQGVFLFRNRDDRSCGTGRPGNRRVHYTGRLQR